jgi:hypothetical protein
VAEQNQGEEERRLLVAQHEANVKKLEGYMVSEKQRQEELLRAQIEELRASLARMQGDGR